MKIRIARPKNFVFIKNYQEEEELMKTTKFHRLVALILAFTFVISGIVAASATDSVEKNHTVSDKVIADYDNLLYAGSYEEYLSSGAFKDAKRPQEGTEIVIDALKYEDGSTGVYVDETLGALYTEAQSEVTWKVNIEAAAKYAIVIDYYSVHTGKSTSIERSLYINGELPFKEALALSISKQWTAAYVEGEITLTKKLNANTIIAELEEAGMAPKLSENGKSISCVIPNVWNEKSAALVDKYDIRFFNTDNNGDEYRSSSTQMPTWDKYYVKDGSGYYNNYFEFLFKQGENTITLKGINEPMAIKKVTLYALKDHISYDEYIKQFEGIPEGKDKIKIEAEYAGFTSTNSVYPDEDRTSPVTSPVDVKHRLLNTIGGEKWATAGQWVQYSFEVGSSGMYDIVSRVRQNVLDGMYVCRALYVYSDGAAEGSLGYYNGIPFEECSRLRYNYNTKWQVTSLTDGTDNFLLYFEEGVKYTLRFEVVLGSMGDIVVKVQDILNTINADYLKIIKLTGTSPDSYTDYDFPRRMPEVLDSFKECSERLDEVSKELKKTAGSSSSNAATLDKVSDLLHTMAYKHRKVASKLDTLKSYMGTIGTFISDAQTQPLQMDYIIIQGESVKNPKANSNFFASLWHEISNFFMSFFRDYDTSNTESDGTQTNDSIEVWIATARDQYNVVRNLVTNDFRAIEENKNTNVNLKLVAGSTLLPSILANKGPDVFLGLDQATAINYAIRGAILPIEDMEGFDETVKSFNESAMITLQMDDKYGVKHTYGLPETQSFPMMFVRVDILSNLGIEIPKTWNDIYAAITDLQANNMQIGYTIDYKIFLYQMGGELFADNGMRINLDSKVGLEAFEKTCDFFTQYSFPYTYDAANRFRTGEMPIIISDYTTLYNTLKVFATEIDGSWTFMPLPGIEDAEGNINNCSVSTVMASVMVNGCKNKERAWDYMQWYTGAQTQASFANEMVAILGDSAKQPAANRGALELMTWSADELEEVKRQFDNLAAIPNYPGSYYIDRYTKFAFLEAYNNGANPVTSLQAYIDDINNEITRKRKEFELETLALNETLASKRLAQAQDELDKIGSAGNAHAALIQSTESAIARSNEKLLRASIADLKAADAALFAKVIGYLTDAADALATY